MKRRDFLTASGAAAAGSAALAAGAGSAAAQEGTTTSGGGTTTTSGGAGNATTTGGAGNETTTSGGSGGSGGGNVKPDFGSYIEGVDGGYKDARGQKEVTVDVGASGNGGNYAFSPAGLWIDTGTKVTWKWTGQGGGHSVTAESGDFDSGVHPDAGHTFTQTFDEGGIVDYYCTPHKSLGMKGAVAVGNDVKTVSAGGGGGGGGGVKLDPENMGVPFQSHFVGIATMLMMAVTLVYTFFVVKYGESRHASSPNRK